ncbi:hypothetical protein [Clostridium sulfidigenes]|nr:hypothetical protein [Clostridium sulfidigenes]
MSVKLLNRYIQLCEELHCEPSLRGLMYFKQAFKFGGIKYE